MLRLRTPFRCFPRVAACGMVAALLAAGAAAATVGATRAAASSAQPSERLARLAPDLPLTITPVPGRSGDAVAVFLSGDGGWGGFDQRVADKLAKAGTPVVGWNARSYFETARTPASATADLQRVIDIYGSRLGGGRVVLVGYSFGADVLPFLVERLPAAERRQVAGIALISPTARAQFSFSPFDWVFPPKTGVAVAPAIARLDPASTLCAYGLGDARSICASLPAGAARMLPRPGGHHIAADPVLVRAILDVASL